jgi:uncharacterized protein (TIGR01777 family)
VRVRIGIVLGRDGGALKQMLTPFRLGIGGRLGSGRQWMSWIHVDDLLRLFVISAENASMEGPLNGTSPGPVTNAEFTQRFAQALHRPAIFPVPKFALKIPFGEFADLMLASARVVPEAPTRLGFKFVYPELGAAFEALL